MAYKTCILQPLDATGDTWSWWLEDENNTLTSGKGTLKSLSLDPAVSVYMMVPGEDVFLIEVDMPHGIKPKHIQAVPFSLEEYLATDIDLHHFSYFNIAKENTLGTAVISKEKLSTFISRAKEYDLNCLAVIPEPLTLPYKENELTLSVTDEKCIVRSSQCEGFSIEHSALPSFLAKSLNESESELTLSVHCVGARAFECYEKELKSHLPTHSVTKEDIPFFHNATALAAKTNQYNLLQGEYQGRGKQSGNAKLWKNVARLAAVSVCILFVGTVFRYYQLQNQNTVIDGEIKKLYKKVFPTATSVNSPRVLLKRELDKVGSGDSGFLGVLAQAGTVISAAKNITITNIHYQKEVTTLSIEAGSFSELESLMKALGKKSLQVKQENAFSHGDKVQARLSIRG